MFPLSGSKMRSSRRVQPVGNRRAPSRFVVAGLAVLLLGASVASAATTVQDDGPAGPGPVQFAVTGSHVKLTLLQTTIGRCNWMAYANDRIAGRIKHRAFRLSKTFSNKSMLEDHRQSPQSVQAQRHYPRCRSRSLRRDSELYGDALVSVTAAAT